jgi:hypothetical protein
VGYKNLWVITRYNRSVLYAMTVNELAESVRLALAQADAAGPMAAPSVAPTAAPTVAPTAAPVAAAPSASPPTL